MTPLFRVGQIIKYRGREYMVVRMSHDIEMDATVVFILDSDIGENLEAPVQESIEYRLVVRRPTRLEYLTQSQMSVSQDDLLAALGMEGGQ